MLSTSFDSISRRMQRIADSIRRDVEASLDRRFETFDVFEHGGSFAPENTWYDMKVKVNDNGHVRVKTVHKEPGKDWDVHIEEYEKGKPAIDAAPTNPSTDAISDEHSPYDNHHQNKSTTPSIKDREVARTSTTTQALDRYSPSRFIQSFADSIKRDVESSLRTTFDTFEVLEHTASLDPENTYYDMKVKVNDNGHVKVKTVHKEPGKDWDVHVEEYHKGKPAIEEDTRNDRSITHNSGREHDRSQRKALTGAGHNKAAKRQPIA